MRIFLIHVRDPQFYALPAATRATNGLQRLMDDPRVQEINRKLPH